MTATRRPILLFVLIMLLWTAGAFAHGIHCTVNRPGGAVVVNCAYDGGTPVANASVRVFSPADESAAYQNGETDRQGVFAFVPNENGVWRLTVDDGTGHMQQVEMTLADDTTNVSSHMPEHSHEEDAAHEHETAAGDHLHVDQTPDIPTAYKVIFGLSLIFGATGIFYGLKARQNRN